MIVIDTSAVIAIFRQEADASVHAARIGEDDQPLISVASVIEASMVLRGLKAIPARAAETWLDRFLEAGGITVEPVTPAQLAIARQGHVQYGKGTGHPAALNFGDCFAYALAKDKNAPLLFKGTDFGQTDLLAV